MSIKYSSDTIGNRSRDLPTCSAVSQPTATRCAPDIICVPLLNYIVIGPSIAMIINLKKSKEFSMIEEFRFLY